MRIRIKPHKRCEKMRTFGFVMPDPMPVLQLCAGGNHTEECPASCGAEGGCSQDGHPTGTDDPLRQQG